MVRKIKIENMKAILKMDIVLGRLNLLTGMNGMGKSSAIQTILLLRQSYLNKSLHGSRLDLNAHLVALGRKRDVFSEFGANFFKIFIENEQGISCDWTFIGNDDDDFILLDRELEIIPEEFFASTSIFNDRFYYLTAERIGPRNHYGIASRSQIESHLFDPRGEFLIQFLATHQQDPIAPEMVHPNLIREQKIRERTESGISFNSLLENVNAWMGEISPEVVIIGTLRNHLELSTLRIGFGTTITASEEAGYRNINVGFGITYVLPVVIALLAARPGQLVIIENPEAHLHPKGQSKMGTLAALAANTGVQVILETHSDHVLNGVRIAAKRKQINPEDIGIFFFDRDPNSDVPTARITSISVNENGRLSVWPTGFFDEYDNALDELL